MSETGPAPTFSGGCHCDSHNTSTSPLGQGPEWLSDRGGKPWDLHRSAARVVGEQYWAAPPEYSYFHKYGDKIKDCSPSLLFDEIVDQSTGELGLRFNSSNFCRVRHCPVCQWRRSLQWAAKIHEILPEIDRLYPKSRWIFLTLTVKNPSITDLRPTLKSMRKAWGKMLKYKEFPALGGTLALEITQGRDGNPHPHYHCLLLVPGSYFKGGNYLSQARWVELWQRAAQLDYLPSVDVRSVKSDPIAMGAAIAEALKYTTKPVDMVDNPQWLWSITEALHRVRSVEPFGVVRQLLKNPPDDEPEEEGEEPGEDVDGQLTFDWFPSRDRYGRRR